MCASVKRLLQTADDGALTSYLDESQSTSSLTVLLHPPFYPQPHLLCAAHTQSHSTVPLVTLLKDLLPLHSQAAVVTSQRRWALHTRSLVVASCHGWPAAAGAAGGRVHARACHCLNRLSHLLPFYWSYKRADRVRGFTSCPATLGLLSHNPSVSAPITGKGGRLRRDQMCLWNFVNRNR